MQKSQHQLDFEFQTSVRSPAVNTPFKVIASSHLTKAPKQDFLKSLERRSTWNQVLFMFMDKFFDLLSWHILEWVPLLSSQHRLTHTQTNPLTFLWAPRESPCRGTWRRWPQKSCQWETSCWCHCWFGLETTHTHAFHQDTKLSAGPAWMLPPYSRSAQTRLHWLLHVSNCSTAPTSQDLLSLLTSPSLRGSSGCSLPSHMSILSTLKSCSSSSSSSSLSLYCARALTNSTKISSLMKPHSAKHNTQDSFTEQQRSRFSFYWDDDTKQIFIALFSWWDTTLTNHTSTFTFLVLRFLSDVEGGQQTAVLHQLSHYKLLCRVLIKRLISASFFLSHILRNLSFRNFGARPHRSLSLTRSHASTEQHRTFSCNDLSH